jgi:DNA-binding NtrC family response regulator
MKILLIDDEQDFVKNLEKFLRKLGHETVIAHDGQSALDLFHRSPVDIIITDIRMPGLDGIEFIRRVKDVMRQHIDIIVITGFSTPENTIKALKYGVRDFFTKPIEIRDLATLLLRCEEDLNKRKKTKPGVNPVWKKSCLAGDTESGFPIAGQDTLHVYSDVMRNTLEKATLYALDPTLPILICGETGTGKELLAQYIAHRHGANKPFIAINCAALPEHLIEAELFGYEKGAFTGASPGGRKGIFELAQDGTIFLDEIGEMNLSLQSKFLRVLDQKTFTRLGGHTNYALYARILTATNRELETAAARGLFRSDLLYRINAGIITIPPLRERRDDILPLAYEFGRVFAENNGFIFSGLSRDVERHFIAYGWPGNVRQLKNAMRLLVLVARGRKAEMNDLQLPVSSLRNFDDVTDFDGETEKFDPARFSLPESRFNLEAFSWRVMHAALEKHKGNITRTAQYLCMSRRQLQGRLKKIRRPPLKEAANSGRE